MKTRFCLLFFLSCLLTNYKAFADSYTPLEKELIRSGYVDVQKVAPGIHVSLMYARKDNFTGVALYTSLHHAFLNKQAAHGLRMAQEALKKIRPDLSLKVYDAARPMRVQAKMYKVVAGTPLNIYVSNPKHGGGLHNYGLAVDITLCKAATGDSIPMGTKIDYMGQLAHVKSESRNLQTHLLSRTAYHNRQLLRKVMARGGFKVLRTEWWHFNFKSRAEAKAHYKVIR